MLFSPEFSPHALYAGSKGPEREEAVLPLKPRPPPDLCTVYLVTPAHPQPTCARACRGWGRPRLKAGRLALTLTSRSCGRCPILELARSPSWASGSLGHPRGAGRRAAQGGRRGSSVPARTEVSATAVPGPQPGAAPPAAALPSSGKSGCRFLTQPGPQPPLARRSPASAPPPPPRPARFSPRLPSPSVLPRASPLCPTPPRLLSPHPFPSAGYPRPRRADPLSLSPGLRQSAGRSGGGGGRRSPGRSRDGEGESGGEGGSILPSAGLRFGPGESKGIWGDLGGSGDSVRAGLLEAGE